MLEYWSPAGPFDAIDMDLLQLTHSHQGSSYVLVCADHYSRFVILAPLLNKSALVVTHALVSHLLYPFATRSLLLSNIGPEFKNEVLNTIFQQYKISQCFIATHIQS